MFGFGRKKAKEEEIIKARIQTIPEPFYGGRDPVVHYTVSSKTARKNKIANKPDSNSHLDFAWLKNKKFAYISGSILFVIIVGLISWYYIREALPASTPEIVIPTPQPQTTTPTPTQAEPITTPTTTIPETEVEPITEIPISLQERELEFPRILLTNSADMDSDALTDLEEEIFGTDPGVWDTDGDGYYDGQEVYNLYNPAGTAPMKLIDSGLVQEYINPTWSYRIYYPSVWQVGNVDANNEQVLFSALTGDFIEISVFEKQASESFTDWFARKALGQSYSDLVIFSNRFKETGWRRGDDLVAYFLTNDNVYVLIYHPGTTGFVPFRHIMQMMVQSFRTSKTAVQIPDQVVLPVVATEELVVEPELIEDI